MGPRGRPMVETAPKGWSQPGFWMGTRHNRGVLALESAKNPWSDERVVVRGERVSNPMNSIHGPYSTNESSWKRRYARRERKFSPPLPLFLLSPLRGAANSNRVTGRKRMMGGEISFRKLHDTFFAIIFVSRKMGNRIENWLKELKDDKIAIKVNFLFFEMGGQKFLMNEALPYVDIIEEGEWRFQFYRF